MGELKRSARVPQLQHDKRSRLSRTNPNRRKTDTASVPLIGSISMAVAAMQVLLQACIGFRLPIVMAGALLARGRRTASSWFRAAGVKDDWDLFYDLPISIRKLTTSLVQRILKMPIPKKDC